MLNVASNILRTYFHANLVLSRYIRLLGNRRILTTSVGDCSPNKFPHIPQLQFLERLKLTGMFSEQRLFADPLSPIATKNSEL